MPESLGKTLKKIRESKHLSLEEISERSRIPKYIVSTIEEDRLNEIKSGFYAKSFVKTYASFLGALDEHSVKEYMAKGVHQHVQKKSEIIVRPKTRPIEVPKADLSIIVKYKKQILAVIIGIFVIWVMSFAVIHAVKIVKNIFAKKQTQTVKISKSENVKPRPKKAPEPKAKDPATVQRLEIKPLILYNASNDNLRLRTGATEKAGVVELEVSALDNTWLQVMADGDLKFTGSFKKGSVDSWKAKKEIKLEVGNSGAIKISVNGKPAGFSGKKGGKKEIVITKDGIKN